MEKIEYIEGLVGKENVLYNEPMKKHTTFKTGGNADAFVICSKDEDIKNTIAYLKKNNINYYVVGNCSNVIVKDEGFKGVIIQLFDKFNKIEVNGENIKAQAGALMSTVSQMALKNGLTGLEFASGIPGTIGGAITMNAGAYDGEMSFVTESVDVLDENGEIKNIKKDSLDLGYRKSVIQTKGLIVLNVYLKLEKGVSEKISEKMKDFAKRRSDKQPLNFPSAGSTFKRPEGMFAGKLIEDSGLKGHTIGGAQVSEKHCGFIINKGDATSQDILDIIDYCKKTVFEKFNVMLETEVKIIG